MPLGIGVPLLCCCWYHSGRLRYSLSSAANSSSRSRKPPSRASSSSRAGLTAPSRATGSRPHWLHSVGLIASKRSWVGLSHDHRRLIDNSSSAAKRSGRWARTVNRQRAFTRHYLTDDVLSAPSRAQAGQSASPPNVCANSLVVRTICPRQAQSDCLGGWSDVPALCKGRSRGLQTHQRVQRSRWGTEGRCGRGGASGRLVGQADPGQPPENHTETSLCRRGASCSNSCR